MYFLLQDSSAMFIHFPCYVVRSCSFVCFQSVDYRTDFIICCWGNFIMISFICCCLSGIINTLRRFWKYSFHLANTSSICEIVLPLVSLQVVGKIDCWGLKVISWKNFLASFFCDYILFVIFCYSSIPFSFV